MRRGVRLGVDVGAVRVGLATSDPDGLLASPLTTLERRRPRSAGGSSAEAIAGLVADHHAVEVVVGLPRSLSGAEGAAAEAARAYAAEIARAVAPVPVRL